MSQVDLRAGGKLIGYARVSTADQAQDRQVADLLQAGVRKDDLYTDQGVSGARDKRPGLDKALDSLEPGDTLVVTTLDRLGRNALHMAELAKGLKETDKHLKVLNLGGEAINTASPTGWMLFQIMAALAEMELAIKQERIRDSVEKRRAHGGDLGGRRAQYGEDTIRGIAHDIEEGMPVSEAVAKRGMARMTYYRRARDMGILTLQK